MSEVSEVIEAPICTCGNDLLQNGGHIHNYLCPCTPKCQHLVTRINIQTGEFEQRPCGSRLEPEYACHGIGCPLVELCPHCGTPMNQRGSHDIDCPNNQFQRLIDLYRIIAPPLPIENREFEVSDDCSICLLSFSNDQTVMKPSGCTHCFHEQCMTQWIESQNKNNHKCPLCRVQIETILKQTI